MFLYLFYACHIFQEGPDQVDVMSRAAQNAARAKDNATDLSKSIVCY